MSFKKQKTSIAGGGSTTLFSTETYQDLVDYQDGEDRYELIEERALKYAADNHIMILSKKEPSCGHCPMSLLCMQGKALLPNQHHTYAFAVCKLCWCVHFTDVENPRTLYICSNIRDGLYSAFPDVSGGGGQLTNGRRLRGAQVILRETEVERILGVNFGRRQGNKRNRGMDPSLREVTCGCCEATMSDIFPDWDGYSTTAPSKRERHFTPLDPPKGMRLPPRQQEQLDDFDCTTVRIHKRGVKIEEK